MKIFYITSKFFVGVFVDISNNKIIRHSLKDVHFLNLILFINQISIFNYNFIRMKKHCIFSEERHIYCHEMLYKHFLFLLIFAFIASGLC